MSALIFKLIDNNNEKSKSFLYDLCHDIKSKGCFHLNGKSEVKMFVRQNITLVDAMTHYPFLAQASGMVVMDALTRTQSKQQFTNFDVFYGAINAVRTNLKEMLDDARDYPVLKHKIRDILKLPLFGLDIKKEQFTGFPNGDESRRISEQLSYFIECALADMERLSEYLSHSIEEQDFA